MKTALISRLAVHAFRLEGRQPLESMATANTAARIR
jgi:hypothetical protein